MTNSLMEPAPPLPPLGIVEIPDPPKGGVHEKGEDVVRRRVMYITLSVFGLTVIPAALTAHWGDKPNYEKVFKQATLEDRRLARELEEAPFEHLKQILQILLPAETALLGSATGFYFGAKAKEG